jgi:diguanylate cyclase (GGDEF)-like protein
VSAQKIFLEQEPTGSHVLVVDDEPVAAREVAAVVRGLGHRVTVSTSWTDALRCFSSEEVDLVLMDAVMPTVDGFKLTKIMRSRATTYVPIVFLTGLRDDATKAQCVAVGADDFLGKPIDPLELRVRLTAMLRIRSLTQDLEAKTRAMTRLASVDGLTGVGNRRSFDERLAEELDRSRISGKPVSLLLLDVDHFKRVNDNYGHAVGDAVLVSLGRLLSELTRACDVPFRFGGEEFAVVASGTHSRQAVYLGERLRSGFALRTRAATSCGPQTLSIGVCGTDQFHADVEPADLVGAADSALYRAKGSGRNCVRTFDIAVDRRAA